MRRFLIGALALLLSLPAMAQSVVQTGQVSPGHAVAWSSSGVIKDAGTSALGKLTTLGITALGGTPLCVSNGTGSGSTAYSQFCMGLDTSNAYFQINGFNGATPLGFMININGTPVALGTGDVTGPASSLNNEVAAFSGTSGKILKQTGILYTALPSLSGTNTWTGANTFSAALNVTGTGSVTLTPTSTGTATINPNTAGTMDNVAIGGSTPKAGAFTTLSASGAQTWTGAATFNGGITASGSNVSDVFSPTGSGTVTINPATAGTMNNMAIGGSTPLAGAFTTLTTSGTGTIGGAATFSSTSTHTGTATFNGALTASPAGANITLSPSTTGTVTINPNTAGTLDNMVIGNATPLAGHFSTLSTTGAATLAAGSVGAPSINFGDATTGFYRLASNQIGVSVSGSLVGDFLATGLNSTAIGTTAASTGAFTTLSSTGLTTLGSGSYSTVATPILDFEPIFGYTTTSNGVSVSYWSPAIVPAGATAGDVGAFFFDPYLDNNAVDTLNLSGVKVRIGSHVGYTGTPASGYAVRVLTPAISGSRPFSAYSGLRLEPFSQGNGNTSGTITNYAIDEQGITSSAGSGGTMINAGALLTLPSGSGGGTTTNYGVYITGNGGSGGMGSTTNWALYSDSTAASSIAGPITLASATIVTTNLATDATHTTRTVCQDTSSKALYFGSGSAGICLGTSSLRFKRADTVRPISDSLGQVLALRPINYFYKQGYGDDGARQQYGFLAEDVAPVIPGLVGLDSDGKPNSVDMVGMVPVLVSAIQDLQREVADLKALIAANDNGIVPASRRAAR